MGYSALANRLLSENGIQSLMEDLTSNPSAIGLGGGNPANLPLAESLWGEIGKEFLADSMAWNKALGTYSSPTGNLEDRQFFAEYFSSEFGVSLEASQISLTNGSQSAFSFLLNSFSGKMEDGTYKKIIFPALPEYIGYSDQALNPNQFLGIKPKLVLHSEYVFEYAIDFSSIPWREAGAICLSRPCNPTGYSVSNSDLESLYNECFQRNIPLIIDSAYGFPFPNLAPNDSLFSWKKGIISVHSFSKIGLPGIRLGVVIGDPKLNRLMSSWASVHSLAVGEFSVQFTKRCLDKNRLNILVENGIKPFYTEQREFAIKTIDDEFQKRRLPYMRHLANGAFFLWLHFPDLPISSQRLYELCKEAGLILVSGHYFFPGLEEPFSHMESCVRLTYCLEKGQIAKGIQILAEQIGKAYSR